MAAGPTKASASWAAALAFVVALATSSVCPGVAWANGAFPDSLQILLPPDRPAEIVLSTNFGLMISDNGGATWTWTCEHGASVDGTLYSLGAPPANRIYTLARFSIGYSEDGSCGWGVAGGLDGTLVTDFFPDPLDPGKVLALGVQNLQSGLGASHLFVSTNGAKTFEPTPVFTAPPGTRLLGVESARADPRRIYLGMLVEDGVHPRLGRSIDGGAQWTTADIEASIGPNAFRIISVDPVDPDVIVLRVIEPAGESVAISHDGGMTFRKPIVVSGQLTAFARLSAGAWVVGAMIGTQGAIFRSVDGGMTFSVEEGTLRLRALAERDGLLYAAADNFRDGWAIGVSADQGATFQPLARYDQVASVRDCARSACQATCINLADRRLWGRKVCASSGDEETAGATSDSGTLRETVQPSGCDCSAVGAIPDAGLGAIALAALLAVAAIGGILRRTSRTALLEAGPRAPQDGGGDTGRHELRVRGCVAER